MRPSESSVLPSSMTMPAPKPRQNSSIQHIKIKTGLFFVILWLIFKNIVFIIHFYCIDVPLPGTDSSGKPNYLKAGETITVFKNLKGTFVKTMTGKLYAVKNKFGQLGNISPRINYEIGWLLFFFN